MRHLPILTLVTMAALGGSAAWADAPPAPPGPFPMQASVFRERIDKLVDHMRNTCNRTATCPKAYVESGLTLIKLRTLEACRDGVVTRQENDWVMSAKPTIPMPPNPHPDEPDHD